MVRTVLDPAAEDGDSFFQGTDASPELRERLERIWKTLWVPYPVGERALDLLQSLYDRPKTHRPPCCAIYGDTNSGKTQIALKFQKDRLAETPQPADQAVIPVVLVQNPPFGDVRGLYLGALRALGAPHNANARLDKLLDQVLTLLRRVQTRLLFIDEIQHILAGKVDQRTIFLNSLKYLSNELQIPVVAIGTTASLRALQVDQQIGNRFEPHPIPRWPMDKDYALFLSRLAPMMGLARESNFRDKALASRFHAMSEGLTGETRKLMGKAAEVAIATGREVIDLETLDQTPWVRPGERRKETKA